MRMANKRTNKKGKGPMIGVSYTNRNGQRVHVMKKDFPNLDAFMDRAENIMLFAKNPRVLHGPRRK